MNKELSIAEVEKEWNENYDVPFDVVFTHYLNLCHPEPFNGYTEEFHDAVQETLRDINYRHLCYDDVVGCERFDRNHKYNSAIKEYLRNLADEECEYYKKSFST